MIFGEEEGDNWQLSAATCGTRGEGFPPRRTKCAVPPVEVLMWSGGENEFAEVRECQYLQRSEVRHIKKLRVCC